jgi:modulator of FtsH protease HflK
MTLRRYLLAALVLASVAFTLWTCAAEVGSRERGVVRRFGRVIATVGPGLYVGLPWGIDRVDRVDIDSVRHVAIGFSTSESDDLGLATPAGQLLTGDHNLVNVQAVIDYVVDDNGVELYVLYKDAADGIVARAAETVLAEWVAARGVDEVLLRGRVVLPALLVEETRKRIEPYQLGVHIQQASVGDVNPPRQVKDAFDAVGRAQTEIQTKVTTALTDAERNWSQALADKAAVERMTVTDVHNKRVLAESDARTFLERLKQVQLIQRDHKEYLAALWLEEMTRIYSGMQEAGRIRMLDSKLSGAGIDILEAPLGPKKK